MLLLNAVLWDKCKETRPPTTAVSTVTQLRNTRNGTYRCSRVFFYQLLLSTVRYLLRRVLLQDVNAGYGTEPRWI